MSVVAEHPPTPPRPTSASSHVTPDIVTNGVQQISLSPSQNLNTTTTNEDNKIPSASDVHPRTLSTSSSNHAGTDTDTAANVKPNILKPKSKKPKKERAHSPTPPPPLPPPPMITVRLNIALGGPSNYEVSIANLARQTGQRGLTPPPPPRDNSDSDSSSEDDNDTANEPAPAVKVKARRKRKEMDYDFDDPFIDDSDLNIDAPTHFAQTKQQGFYVSSGDVALVKDKSPNKKIIKPRSSVPAVPARPSKPTLTSLLATATANATAPAKVTPGNMSMDIDISMASRPPHSGLGTQESPIALDDEADAPKAEGQRTSAPPTKRMKTEAGSIPNPVSSNATHTFVVDGKTRTVDKTELEANFNPQVTTALHGLKAEIDKTKWETKGRFPQNLKPILVDVATLALKLGDYNDSFFDYMPFIFPYNRFTMMKLTTKLMYNIHQQYLTERQDALLAELKQIGVDDFERAKEDYAKACVAWEEKQKKKQLEKSTSGAASGAEGSAMDVDASNTSRAASPAGVAAEDASDNNHGNGTAGGTPANGTHKQREEKPPQKRFKWTDDIKSRVWGLLHLCSESCRINALVQ
ncbi:hypothetical protein FRC02_004883 [Tulasnella sp. 418]|nr:hypothetical protein FRC02_004883 [Tulasnella sp. 418]